MKIMHILNYNNYLICIFITKKLKNGSYSTKLLENENISKEIDNDSQSAIIFKPITILQ